MIDINRVNELIEFYKERLIIKGGLKGCNELYKWELITKYQGRPNLDSPNLEKEFSEVKFHNLVYHVAPKVMKFLAQDAPKEYHEFLSQLYDESKDLTQRILNFTSESSKLFKEIELNKSLSSHHDERTAATLLTYHDPIKYTFFKPTLYKSVCQMLKLKAKKEGRYQHYLDILNELIPIMKQDNDLIDLINKETNTFLQSDLLLAQDMMYQTSYTLQIFNITVKDGIYSCDVDVSVEEWKLVLQDASICNNLVREYLIKFIVSTEYKSTCKEVGDYFKVSPQSVNRVLTAFCKATQNALHRFTVKGIDGKTTYWPIAMHGRNLNNRLFEWQLRENLVTAMEELEMTTFSETKDNDKEELMLDPIVSLLNKKKQIILQGAPGTGKTYKTTELAVGICNPTFQWKIREQLMAEYARLKNLGQISFTTFHQSMDYEEFIEGLKPVKDSNPIRFEPHAGLFKEISDKALLDSIKLTKENFSSLEYDEVYDKMISDIQNGIIKELVTKTGTPIYLSITQQNNIQFAYSEGGRKYTVSKDRLRKLYDVYDDLKKVNDILNINDGIRSIIGGCDTSAYWTALKYIVSNKQTSIDLDVDIDNLSDKEQFKIVQEFLATPKEQRTLTDEIPNYVLIVDEINRGNISKIFGELITLLENDKRVGERNELVVRLPYSHSLFGVPANLYIIGTMNTADRSVGFIDYAIRRRFAFVSIYSDRSIIESFYSDAELKECALSLFDKIHDIIYENIAYEFCADDIMIGHSYFMASSKEELAQNLDYGIKPLLREYASDGILSMEREKTGKCSLIEELLLY